MAAGGSRTLKLSILADVDNLRKGLTQGENDVQTFGDKLGKFGKMAGAAFAAAGAAAVAYAGKLAIDGVKAAVEDAAAQEKLAATLENVTGATEATIAATEDYITQTTLATGVTDDELRPSLDRLVRATGDVTKAMQLQKLALDVSAGTGKNLEAVTNALGKAYEGNTAALGKLGLGISQAELKTMSFDQVTAALAKTFEGQAARQADTFAGKMQRLQVAFDEGKETVGAYILDAITPMVDNFVNKVIPALSEVSGNLGEKLGPAFRSIGTYISNIFGPVLEGLRSAWAKITKAFQDNREELQPLFDAMMAFGKFARDTFAPILGTVLGKAFDLLGTIISRIIDLIAKLTTGIKAAIDAATRLKNSVGGFFGFGNASFTNAGLTSEGFVRLGAATTTTTDGAFPMVSDQNDLLTRIAITRESLNMGGFQTAEQTWAAIRAAQFVAGGTRIIGQQEARDIIINVQGNLLDPEGAARAIADTLNNSAGRSGNYSTLGIAPNTLVNA